MNRVSRDSAGVCGGCHILACCLTGVKEIALKGDSGSNSYKVYFDQASAVL